LGLRAELSMDRVFGGGLGWGVRKRGEKGPSGIEGGRDGRVAGLCKKRLGEEDVVELPSRIAFDEKGILQSDWWGIIKG